MLFIDNLTLEAEFIPENSMVPRFIMIYTY